ncbi:GNAT family N-acetyltransferase [Oscillatoria sp. FACHB-1406]|nr:GNAT family N-acetyltransferase [Oscillatoria sp. FACHB-1406]
MELIELETERLYLRQWQDSDRAPFAQLNADYRVMECFPATLDPAASDALVERLQAFILQHGWGFWAAELKETGAFIGFIGLNIPGYDLPFSPCVEIGWRLAFSYWGKGLATEGAKAALRCGFESLNLLEIVSFTAEQNTRSRNVMKRLGMTEAGTFYHPLVPAESPLRLHYWYRLDREMYGT